MAIAAERKRTVEVPEGPLTWTDVQAFPPGLRYELIDGVLLVSPGPSLLHQRAVKRLLRILDEAAPDDHEAVAAPFDWYVDEWTYFEPDLVVIRPDDASAQRYEDVPLLAVEVLSPSSRRRDHGIKRRAYEDAGLAHYWVVDPDEPSLTVFQLTDGRLVEQAKVAGEAAYESTDPVTASVVPADLIKA